jgi:hypothetical protein
VVTLGGKPGGPRGGWARWRDRSRERVAGRGPQGHLP